MSEEFDWEGLKKRLPKLKHKTMLVTLPDRDPPRVLSGVTPGIYPIVDSLQTTTDVLKIRKKSGLDTSYYLPLYSIPLTPQTENQMTPQDLSTKLGFDTEAMIKPKTNADVSAVLDEAISLMEMLNKNFDDFAGYHSREDFRTGDHSFSQVMDEDDNAHIFWLDPEIKKNILDNNLVGVSPWVEIFKIDGNYCNFTNKHGKVVGRLRMKFRAGVSFGDAWEFTSEKPVTGHFWNVECSSKYPYDCEREIMQWMARENLLDAFMNHNPE